MARFDLRKAGGRCSPHAEVLEDGRYPYWRRRSHESEELTRSLGIPVSMLADRRSSISLKLPSPRRRGVHAPERYVVAAAERWNKVFPTPEGLSSSYLIVT
jgi:hypothetical protein